jgi:hypothetical protein
VRSPESETRKANTMKHRLLTTILLLACCLIGFAPVAQAFYNPDTGRWLSREPLGELVSRNPYGMADNDALNFFDLNGLEKGAQRLMSRSGKSGGGMGFMTGMRNLLGLPFSLLSGDMFAPGNEKFGPGICKSLIVVNGILNTRDAAEGILESLMTDSARYGRAFVDDGIASQNPTTYIGDFVQIIGDELGLIQSASRQVAQSINQAYEALKSNSCCCGNIQVFAHSHGTKVVERALPMVKREAKAFICYTGIGGQARFNDDGFAISPEHYANWYDFVPDLPSFLPWNWPQPPATYTGTDTSGHGFDYYRNFVNQLPANCPCVPVP